MKRRSVNRLALFAFVVIAAGVFAAPYHRQVPTNIDQLRSKAAAFWRHHVDAPAVDGFA